MANEYTEEDRVREKEEMEALMFIEEGSGEAMPKPQDEENRDRIIKQEKQTFELAEETENLKNGFMQDHMDKDATQEDMVDRALSWIVNTNLVQNQIGIAEAGATMISGMKNLPVALFKGAYEGSAESYAQAGGDISKLVMPSEEEASAAWDASKEAFEEAMQVGVYMPKTETGERAVGGVTAVGKFIESWTSGLAHDATLAVTGKESVADAAYMTTEALLVWLPFNKTAMSKIGKGVVKTAKGAKVVAKTVAKPTTAAGNFVLDLVRPKRKHNIIEIDSALDSHISELAEGGVKLRTRLREAQRLEEKWGIKLSVGEATGDTASISLENSLAAGSGTSQRMQATTKIAKIKKLDVAAKKQIVVRESIKKDLIEKLQKAQSVEEAKSFNEIARIENAINDEVYKMAKSTTPEIRGTMLRNKFDKLYTAAKEAGGALFEKAKLGDFQINTTQVASYAKGHIKDMFPTGKGIPDSLVRFIKANKKQTDPMLAPLHAGGKGSVHMSFKDVRGHLKDMRDDWARAKATDDSRTAKILNDVIKQIEGDGGVLDQVTHSTNKALVQTYRDAKTNWKNNVVDKFETHVGEMLYRVDGTGALKVAPENIIDKLIKTDTGANSTRYLQEFEQIFGSYSSKPAAWRQLEETITSRYADKAFNIKTGKVNVGAAAAFVKQHEQVLTKFPGLKEKLLHSDSALGHLAKQRKIQLDRATVAGQTKLAANIKSGNVAGVVEEALDSPVALKVLTDAASTSTELRVAVQKITASSIHRKASKKWTIAGEEYNILDGSKILDTLEANTTTYTKLLGAPLYDELVSLAGAHKAIARTNVPTSIVAPSRQASTGPIQNLTGTSFPSLLAQYRNVRYGRDNFVNFGARTMATAGLRMRYKSFVEVELAALHNVEVASILNKMATAKRPPTMATLKSWGETFQREVGVSVTIGAATLAEGQKAIPEKEDEIEKKRQEIIERVKANRKAKVM